MSIDPKVIEALKKKISTEGQDEVISKILETWLNELDQGIYLNSYFIKQTIIFLIILKT